MSTNVSNLFAFDRALPAPFDTLRSKKLSVSSKYGDGTASTLCASVIKEYTRKKILFAAAAIGDDKPSIERIYGDSFLDITDLNQLPIKLTTLVKRHIRV